jgi:hypothetical protein
MGHHFSSSSRNILATGNKSGKAVNRNRGRAVTVAGSNIKAMMMAEYAMYINGMRCFHKATMPRMSASIEAAVSSDVGELV